MNHPMPRNCPPIKMTDSETIMTKECPNDQGQPDPRRRGLFRHLSIKSFLRPSSSGIRHFPIVWSLGICLRLTKLIFSEHRFLRFLCLIFNFSFLIFNSSALTPVVYNASDFTGTTNNNPVTLTSIQRLRVNNQTMLVGLPVYFTPTNGTYTTNLYAGLYNLAIQGIPVGVTCLVPDSTNVQNLASCVVSNMGLFSATNLNFLITNPVVLLPGTNIQMITNGFNVTISGVVTNLSGLVISNGTFSGVFLGDGSQLTNLQASDLAGNIPLNQLTNALYGPVVISNLTVTGGGTAASIDGVSQFNAPATFNAVVTFNGIVAGLTSNSIPGLNATNINSGQFVIAQGGTGNTSGWANGLSNSTDIAFQTFYVTNIGTQPFLMSVPPIANQTNYNFNGGLVFLVVAAHGAPGLYFTTQGTNFTTGIALSIYTNAVGQRETNYLGDQYAMTINVTPNQSGTSNSAPGGNINKGVGNIFMNGEPFALGTLIFGDQWDYMIETNGVVYFLYYPNSNYDGIADSGAKSILVLDGIRTNAMFTNIGFFTINAGNLNVSGNGFISANGINAGLSMPSGTGTFTNMTLAMKGSSSSDFLPLITIPNAGGGAGEWYWGLRDDSGHSMYWGTLSTVMFQLDGNSTAVHSMVPLLANEITSSNAPTFGTTNATPSGWTPGSGATSPRIWIPFTNGATVYYLPGY